MNAFLFLFDKKVKILQKADKIGFFLRFPNLGNLYIDIQNTYTLSYKCVLCAISNFPFIHPYINGSYNILINFIMYYRIVEHN